MKVFCRGLALLTPNHTFKICGDPYAFTSTTIFEKCGVRLAQDDRNTTY